MQLGRPKKFQELRPIREPNSYYDEIEKHIKDVFRFLIYEPLIRELNLPRETIKNAFDALLEALEAGRITAQIVNGNYVFQGAFNAQVSRRLRELGAIWRRRGSSFLLAKASLPYEMQVGAAVASNRFLARLEAVDQRLTKILPEAFAEFIDIAGLIDPLLWKVERDLGKTFKGIAITPTLTAQQRRRIAVEWQENMRIWIKDFTTEEIVKLRTNILKTALSGNRYDSVTKAIRASYGVTANKAKFLARQETSLLMTKFKEVRYTEAGITEYRWACVAGSKTHPVRPAHKILDGKIFSWDHPPITTEPGEPVRRNNPGQDFNCRCSAIPIIRRQKE